MNVVAFDTETHTAQPGLVCPPLVCGSWADARTEATLSRDDALKFFARSIGTVRIRGTQLVYDLGIVANEDPSLLPRIFDALERGQLECTSVAEALRDIALGEMFVEDGRPFNHYSMAISAKRHLGLDLSADKFSNPWRVRYALLQDVPLEDWEEAAYTYPMKDARTSYDIGAKQEGGPNWHDLPRQMRAAFSLHLSSIHGARTDATMVADLSAFVRKQHAETVATFTAAGIYRAAGSKDTGSLKQRVAAAYGDFWCAACKGEGSVEAVVGREKVVSATGRKSTRNIKGQVVCKACDGVGKRLHRVPRTDSGEVKCDRDTLEESGDELLMALAESGENEKLYSTYLTVLEQGTAVPINPEWNVLVATGRTSCRSPNLQNLPRNERIRNCFVPRPGFVFADCDYSTLELCTLAQCTYWMFGRSAMRDALNEGKDLHILFAASMAGVSYEEMKRRIKAKDPVAKGLRQLAKAANFGFPGGMGAGKLVLTGRKQGTRFCLAKGVATECGTVKVTEWSGRPCPPSCKACLEVAAQLRKDWLKQWPEMGPYFDRIAIETEGEGGGSITQFVSDRVRGQCGFCDGANTRFQGLAADLAKDALWRVTRECYTVGTALYGCRVFAFVHDQLILEAPEGRAAEAAERLSWVMCDTGREWCPDVPFKAAPVLTDRWYKEASEVRDAFGRLLVWTPEAPT